MFVGLFNATISPMTDLKKSVLATIIYYDVLDFPMTAGEISQWLINPVRFGPAETAPPLSDEVHPGGWTSSLEQAPAPEERHQRVERGLTELRRAGLIEERGGCYFLTGRSYLFQERMEKNKLAEEKWKKARRYLFWVQALPFVEAVLASGSLALGHTSEESDLDILIIARPGRIWTVRLLVYLWLGLRGVRRRKEQLVAPNKICPNHYLTTSSLRIPFSSLYNAQTYVHLAPIYTRDKSILENFAEANRWIADFIWSWKGLGIYPERVIRHNGLLKILAGFSQKILDFVVGGWLEKMARRVQIKRIKTNLPGRITISDQQLEFHPYSVEGKILDKYNETIARSGFFGDYREIDSGLS